MVPDKLWETKEILNIIDGLMRAKNALPWPLRWLMKPWYDALEAVRVAIAGEELCCGGCTSELANAD